MKSKAQEAYEKVRTRLLRAPGMIEESERRLLFKSAHAKADRQIIEFGAFFGASTLCLALGAMTGRPNNDYPLISFDAFECGGNNPLHKYVLDYAKRTGLIDLITIDKSGKVNWKKVTERVLGEQTLRKVKLIKTVVDEDFSGDDTPAKPVGLLHLDLPKDARTIKPIVKAIFPKIEAGGIIAFQDYAYQFSNELIAYFELLEQNSILTKTAIAASSSFFRLTRTLSGPQWQGLLEESQANETALVNNAAHRYERIPSARKQEIIAMHSAAIRSITKSSNRSEFKSQSALKDLLNKIYSLDKARSSFVIAELLTEDVSQFN